MTAALPFLLGLAAFTPLRALASHLTTALFRHAWGAR